MESLRIYLNSLDKKTQIEYAIRCGTSIGYLRKAISRHHRIDGALARLLDIESGSLVNKGELRPDIWPELKEPEHA